MDDLIQIAGGALLVTIFRWMIRRDVRAELNRKFPQHLQTEMETAEAEAARFDPSNP